MRLLWLEEQRVCDDQITISFDFICIFVHIKRVDFVFFTNNYPDPIAILCVPDRKQAEKSGSKMFENSSRTAALHPIATGAESSRSDRWPVAIVYIPIL